MSNFNVPNIKTIYVAKKSDLTYTVSADTVSIKDDVEFHKLDVVQGANFKQVQLNAKEGVHYEHSFSMTFRRFESEPFSIYDGDQVVVIFQDMHGNWWISGYEKSLSVASVEAGTENNNLNATINGRSYLRVKNIIRTWGLNDEIITFTIPNYILTLLQTQEYIYYNTPTHIDINRQYQVQCNPPLDNATIKFDLVYDQEVESGRNDQYSYYDVVYYSGATCNLLRSASTGGTQSSWNYTTSGGFCDVVYANIDYPQRTTPTLYTALPNTATKVKIVVKGLTASNSGTGGLGNIRAYVYNGSLTSIGTLPVQASADYTFEYSNVSINTSRVYIRFENYVGGWSMNANYSFSNDGGIEVYTGSTSYSGTTFNLINSVNIYKDVSLISSNSIIVNTPETVSTASITIPAILYHQDSDVYLDSVHVLQRTITGSSAEERTTFRILNPSIVSGIGTVAVSGGTESFEDFLEGAEPPVTTTTPPPSTTTTSTTTSTTTAAPAYYYYWAEMYNCPDNCSSSTTVKVRSNTSRALSKYYADLSNNRYFYLTSVTTDTSYHYLLSGSATQHNTCSPAYTDACLL